MTNPPNTRIKAVILQAIVVYDDREIRHDYAGTNLDEKQVEQRYQALADTGIADNVARFVLDDVRFASLRS